MAILPCTSWKGTVRRKQKSLFKNKTDVKELQIKYGSCRWMDKRKKEKGKKSKYKGGLHNSNDWFFLFLNSVLIMLFGDKNEIESESTSNKIIDSFLHELAFSLGFFFKFSIELYNVIIFTLRFRHFFSFCCIRAVYFAF